MIFLYLLIGIIFQILPVIFSEQFVCTSSNSDTINRNVIDQELGFNGAAIVTFKRNDLAVYRYSNIQYVNLLLDDVKLKFEGIYKFTNNNNFTVSSPIKTTVEGIALLEKNQVAKNKTDLVKCELDLIKNVVYSSGDTLAKDTKKSMVESVKECVQQKLCAEINQIVNDDYIRGDIRPYDFKKNSGPYRAYSEKYFNLAAPYKQVKDLKMSSTETAVNLALDILASYGISQLSKKHTGIIEFPDTKEDIKFTIFNGYYHLLNGTVGDLKTITRAQNSILTSEGLELAIEAAYRIPKPYIHFDKIEFKFAKVLHVQGKLDVTVDEFYFKIKIVVNFNRTPCKVETSEIDIKIGKIKLQLSKNITFKDTISKILTKITAKLHGDITSFAKAKVMETVKVILGKFNCEDFRP